MKKRTFALLAWVLALALFAGCAGPSAPTLELRDSRESYAHDERSAWDGFLAADGVLNLMINVTGGLVVYPKVIEKHLMAELPFMATENILMDAVKAGGDRQELHEKIRQLSMEAGRVVKEEGRDNDLLERIAADPAFNLTEADLGRLMDPALYVGRAPQQVEAYLRDVVRPLLDKHAGETGVTVEITV